MNYAAWGAPCGLHRAPTVPSGDRQTHAPRPCVMDELTWGYAELGLFALVFGGLQIWWIGSTLRGRRLARPMTDQEFRRSLERIWSRDRRRR